MTQTIQPEKLAKPAINWRAKAKATGIHITLSLVIFLILATWIVWQLYPAFLLDMHGGKNGLMLMFGVDVVLGPMLTFLIFNPNKKKREIISDLVIVGLVQLAALIYGLHTVYTERPQLMTMYAEGTGIVVSASEVQKNDDLKAINLDNVVHLNKIPLLIHDVNPQTQQVTYTDAKLLPEKMEALNQINRKMMDNDEKQQLAEFEKQHGNVWVITMMGKYTGAYILLDKQFQYLGKLAEKEMG